MRSKLARYISCQTMLRASKTEALIPRMTMDCFWLFSQECPCRAGIHPSSSTSFSLPVLTS
jgi:hypothetical protein